MGIENCARNWCLFSVPFCLRSLRRFERCDWDYLKVDNNWFESPYVCPMVYSLRPLDGDFPPNIEDVLDANFDLLFNAVLALVYVKVAGTDK